MPPRSLPRPVKNIMTESRHISINVPVLARVEGEGALELNIRDNLIEDLKLRIYEPPRLFEKFLEGRSYHEVPDIVARICGICPVAYQMSAVHAIEQVFSCDPGPWVRAMRRVMYCGEWIESHSLHIHLLAAPDFLGYTSAPDMARDYPGEVRRGLRLQALGNEIISLCGGRSVHPVGVRVGGFHHAPAMGEVVKLREKLQAALNEAKELIFWTASLGLDDNPLPFTSVALCHSDEYPMNEGRLVSSSGLDCAIEEFEKYIVEHQVAHSTAFHALLKGKPYLVGPLARMNLNMARLPHEVVQVVHKTGITFPSQNMFHSIVARAVEIYYALTEAIRILEDYKIPESPCVEVMPRNGVGYGCTEAPRGLLWHRYELNKNGEVIKAVIVPPTSQNQARIEEDLEKSLETYGVDRSDDDIRLYSEKIIRNYDPCISCSTHFLKVNIQRQ